MLVLSRHRDEAVIIGDDISIVVADIRGDKVRLGIEAPREIPVHRKEVYEAIIRDHGKVCETNSLNFVDKSYQFCSKEKATEHYDFISEKWVDINKTFVDLFDCRLYRRPVAVV